MTKDTFEKYSPLFGSALYDNLHSLINNQQPQVQPEPKKNWVWGLTVNENHYHVPFSRLYLNKLIEQVKIGGCYIVQGPFRSGKTSHLLALQNSLSQSYFTIVITMTTKTPNDFWNYITNEIKHFLPNIPKITNSIEFCNLFSVTNNTFGTKKAVLLFDEFQVVEDCGERIDLLSSIKKMIDSPLYRLQSVVSFGTSQLISITNDLTNKELLEKLKPIYSPFVLNNITFIGPLPSHEVSLLLQQWANDHKIVISHDVITDIYDTTGGYPGLLGFIGVILDNNGVFLLKQAQSQQIDVNTWLVLRQQAYELLRAQPQIDMLVRYIKRSEQVRSILNTIMFQSDPYTFKDEQIDAAITLSAFGVLWMENANSFNLASPMMREVLLNIFYRTINDPIVLPDNWISSTPILLEYIFKYFDAASLTIPESLNITTRFPSEYIFQAEFYATLRRAILDTPSTTGMHKATIEAKHALMGRKRADILLRNGRRMLFELKAAQKWEKIDDIIPSINQAVKYSTYLQCESSVVVNFVKNVSPFSNIDITFTNLGNRKVTVYEALFDGQTVKLHLPAKTYYNSSYDPKQ